MNDASIMSARGSLTDKSNLNVVMLLIYSFHAIFTYIYISVVSARDWRNK